MSLIEHQLHNFIEDAKANLLRAKTNNDALDAIGVVQDDLNQLKERLTMEDYEIDIKIGIWLGRALGVLCLFFAAYFIWWVV